MHSAGMIAAKRTAIEREREKKRFLDLLSVEGEEGIE